MLGDRISSTVDLTAAYTILSFTATLLAVYVMQQSWHDNMSKTDPKWLQWSRRSAFALLALGVMWVLQDVVTTGARPHPALMLVVIALNLQYFTRAVLLFLHRDRVPPRQQVRQR